MREKQLFNYEESEKDDKEKNSGGDVMLKILQIGLSIIMAILHL